MLAGRRHGRGPPALGGSVASAGIGGVAGPAVSGASSSTSGWLSPCWPPRRASPRSPPGCRAPGAARPGRAPPGRPRARGLARDRGLIGAAAAVVTAGLTTGVCALLVPADCTRPGRPPPDRPGLRRRRDLVRGRQRADRRGGRRAVNLTVICAACSRQAAAFSLAVVSTARSLWSDAVPHDGGPVRPVDGQLPAGRPGGRGAASAWAPRSGCSTASGRRPRCSARWRRVAAGHLGDRGAFGLTQAACAAALAVTVIITWPARRRIPAAAGAGALFPRGYRTGRPGLARAVLRPGPGTDRRGTARLSPCRSGPAHRPSDHPLVRPVPAAELSHTGHLGPGRRPGHQDAQRNAGITCRLPAGRHGRGTVGCAAAGSRRS